MMPVALLSLACLPEDRRRVTEVALMLGFSKSYNAFTLLAEKRIYKFLEN
ncbi:hypothetical protein J2X69_004414 [Algoriphagus sp. 4150]|nr:hypothetical protein [Algoriphagus sp. 4150]MDR7132048.1 hypothetical protein [Algoriphagus sp. 4150]